MLDGIWKAKDVWVGIDSGVVEIAPFNEVVPQPVQDHVTAKKKAIADGGLLGMKWFVEGVDGDLGE